MLCRSSRLVQPLNCKNADGEGGGNVPTAAGEGLRLHVRIAPLSGDVAANNLRRKSAKFEKFGLADIAAVRIAYGSGSMAHTTGDTAGFARLEGHPCFRFERRAHLIEVPYRRGRNREGFEPSKLRGLLVEKRS